MFKSAPGRVEAFKCGWNDGRGGGMPAVHLVWRSDRCQPVHEAMEVARDPSKSLMIHVGRCDGGGCLGGGVDASGLM